MIEIIKYLRLLKSYKAIKNIQLRDLFDDTEFYVFHHIPKCGGTSLVEVLRAWFIVLKHYSYSHATKQVPYPNFLYRKAFVLAGHFDRDGYRLKDNYPNLIKNTNVKIFTFLRDPLSLKKSLYYYEKSIMPKEHIVHKTSLEEHLFKRKNYLANRIPCTKDDYIQILDRYFFIGIFEDYKYSVNKLANLINKPPIAIPHLNISKNKKSKDFSPDIVEKFKEENELDYLIYNYAVERFKNINI